ncbi:30S ribosomal protein S5 [endosymbiont GvMRE of Glomus versiforme]|jgi:small subunit ribosomal protein S5|uniref:30S ribosomal protein S5 n=1 Tax=endosymbiont GvMRE of Glomus versiforme TaxID=2039283 RepID=UPI000EC08C8F|nr:30S ribosomal protein S5 [endosymbiont GvMRE of Glomus versiforme]RHZ36250.1 30S ribosomal protein S5 [endosymbiont GvMRE of Glomus versiforme]
MDNEKNDLVGQISRRNRNYKQRQRREPKEPVEKIILAVNPVDKVTKGGRQRRFTALVLVKKEKSVAFGYARGKDVFTAIKTATDKAVKAIHFTAIKTATDKAVKAIHFAETPRTIPYDFKVKFCATKILFRPAPPGSGIIAGGVINSIFKYLGIKDVSAKIINSNNKLNVVKCTFKALNKIAKRRNN